ncbi:MAG: type II toxin-antitoxin system Phd/YefM family antitoxin [Thermoanaerobaculia bacterium]|nr:type II toxin-antitoxin system Phd/YefM family antitoxin [Thermoanaerobaculia bacterium]
MTTVTTRALKDRLGSFLARAEGGERFVVLRDGKPVAAVIPMSQLDDAGRFARLAALAQEGVVELPTGPRRAERADPLPSRGRFASEMILEDRR